jgi:hypothetical protein
MLKVVDAERRAYTHENSYTLFMHYLCKDYSQRTIICASKSVNGFYTKLDELYFFLAENCGLMNYKSPQPT